MDVRSKLCLHICAYNCIYANICNSFRSQFVFSFAGFLLELLLFFFQTQLIWFFFCLLIVAETHSCFYFFSLKNFVKTNKYSKICPQNRSTEVCWFRLLFDLENGIWFFLCCTKKKLDSTQEGKRLGCSCLGCFPSFVLLGALNKKTDEEFRAVWTVPLFSFSGRFAGVRTTSRIGLNLTKNQKNLLETRPFRTSLALLKPLLQLPRELPVFGSVSLLELFCDFWFVLKLL